MSNVPEVKYCPCGFTPYLTSWNFGYEFCPQCKVRLLPGGTTGPTYAELEARIAELEARELELVQSLKFLADKFGDCKLCKHSQTPYDEYPCLDCTEIGFGWTSHFSEPIDAEWRANAEGGESEILRCAQNDSGEHEQSGDGEIDG